MEDERADEVEAAAAPILLHTASNVGKGGRGMRRRRRRRWERYLYCFFFDFETS